MNTKYIFLLLSVSLMSRAHIPSKLLPALLANRLKIGQRQMSTKTISEIDVKDIVYAAKYNRISSNLQHRLVQLYQVGADELGSMKDGSAIDRPIFRYPLIRDALVSDIRILERAICHLAEYQEKRDQEIRALKKDLKECLQKFDRK